MLDEVDKYILDILGLDADARDANDGLDITDCLKSERSENEDDEPTPFSADVPPPVAKQNRYPLKRPAAISSSHGREVKQLRMDLLEVEIYHRKLQCLQLERELCLTTSRFTKHIK